MNVIDRTAFAELLTQSAVKPRLKRDLRFAGEEITDWKDRDFLAVMNRARSEGVLIAPFATRQIVPFRIQKRTANASGRVEAIICDFCASWQRGSNSAVISFTKEKGSVSFLCCGDLLCSLHVRDKTTAAKLSRTQLRENNTQSDRIKRLRMRMSKLLALAD